MAKTCGGMLQVLYYEILASATLVKHCSNKYFAVTVAVTALANDQTPHGSNGEGGEQLNKGRYCKIACFAVP